MILEMPQIEEYPFFEKYAKNISLTKFQGVEPNKSINISKTATVLIVKPILF